jgi:hypothetical protein
MSSSTSTTSSTSGIKTWMTRIVTSTLTLGAIGGLSLGLYGHHGDTFHHETHRFLEEMSAAKGIQITLIPRKGSPNDPSGMQVHCLLYPRKNAVTNQLEFDGRLSYVHVEHEYNFTMINNRGYVTVQHQKKRELIRNDCLHRDNLPPLHTLTEVLTQARVIDQVSSAEFNLPCPNGKLVEFEFAGEPYVFCSKKGGSLDQIHGEDLEASIKLLTDNSEGNLPSLDSLIRPQGHKVSECDLLIEEKVQVTKETTSQRKLVMDHVNHVSQRTKDAFLVAIGSRRLGNFGDSECSCKGGKKACLFVHGLGQTDDGPAQDTFPEYWGQIDQQAQCCSSMKFMRMDTTNNPWHGQKLARKMCDVAQSMISNDDPMKMKDVALIGHSMGNLIISAAAMQNYCAIDPKTSKWIALTGPITGSMSAILGINACADNPNWILKYPLIRALTWLGVCPVGESQQSLAFVNSSRSTAELNQHFDHAARIYKKYVSSNLCGVDPVGLKTLDSGIYWALNVVSQHQTKENDGAVDFPSCRASLDETAYKTSWRNAKFYKASLNHPDGAFRNGDGWWGGDRKPIKWFNCQF